MLAIRAPLPPATNHLYFVANGRKVLSAEGRAYKAMIGQIARMAASMPGAWPIEPAFEVSVFLYLETRRVRDVDGSNKVLLDGIFRALKEIDPRLDDNLIVDLHIYKRLDAANPRVDVIVKAAEGEPRSWPVILRAAKRS